MVFCVASYLQISDTFAVPLAAFYDVFEVRCVDVAKIDDGTTVERGKSFGFPQVQE